MFRDYLRLIRWDKPIGTLLLLWPTLGALLVAGNGKPPLYAIIVFTLGVFLTRSAGCAINDAADASFDKHVARTKGRPVAAGNISKLHAFICGGVLSCIAFIMAYHYLHRNTLYLSIPALFIFVSYPYMKRFFPMPQAYLGLAFSFGILMAFIEVSGRLNLLSGLLFLANMCWVLGYDTIYAMVDIEDDLKIGIKTSAITLGRIVVPFIAICYTLYFIIFYIIGSRLNLGMFYYLCLSLSGGLLMYQVMLLFRTQTEKYFKLFLLNNWVGMCVFTGLLVGLWLNRFH